MRTDATALLALKVTPAVIDKDVTDELLDQGRSEALGMRLVDRLQPCLAQGHRDRNLKYVPSGPLKGFPKASLEAVADSYIAPWGEVVELMTRIPTVGPDA